MGPSKLDGDLDQRGPRGAKKLVAEGLGTFVLLFFAVGSAVGGTNVIGDAGVAFAFGPVLLALVYPIRPVSGCHVNRS